jgi:hypothetical protein
MIALAFALAGLALLMLQLLATDTVADLLEISKGHTDAFDHDTKIYPDHLP